MDFLFSFLRKTLVGIITFVFTFVIVYVPQNYTSFKPVPEAQAVVGPGAKEFTQLVNTAANTVSAGAEAASLGKETILDSIAFAIAKAMISQILQSLIVWINSGFKGSPAFVQDLDRFLLNVADEAAGEFLKKELGEFGSFICEPFRVQIRLALALKYQKARENRPDDSCKLSNVVKNVENFYKGNLKKGDFWKQWFKITSKPEAYTPYGQFITAEEQMQIRITNRKGQVLTETNWGGGFLSGKVCEVIEGKGSANGKKLSSSQTQALADKNPDGSSSSQTQAVVDKQPKATGSKKCVISKPGQVIASQLNKALGAGQDQLVAADEINEVISALLAQVANQALIGAAGLLGLSAGTGYTSGGYGSGSYVDELARQSYGSGSYLEQGFAQAKDKLVVQEKYNALALEYIPKFEAMFKRPLLADDVRGEIQTSLEDAKMVRDITTEHIGFLKPLVTEYEKLEKEAKASTTPTARLNEIRKRQGDIISETINYRAYTKERYDASRREWARIAG